MNRAVDPAGVSIAAGDWRLRPTAPADRAGIAACGQAPNIVGRMPWFPSPFPEHYADGWLERAAGEWAAGRHWVLSILDVSGAYVGSVVLSAMADDTVELSFWVLPAFEGRGAATAAAVAALAWARSALKPKRFFAKTRPGGFASQRVLAKAGFVATGDAARPTFALEVGER